MSFARFAISQVGFAAFTVSSVVLLDCDARAGTVIVDSFDSAPYSFSRNYYGGSAPFLGETVTATSATTSDILADFPSALHTRSYYHKIISSSGSAVRQSVTVASGSLNLTGGCTSFSTYQSMENVFRLTYGTAAAVDLSALTSINLSGAVTDAYRISGNPGSFAVRVKLMTTTGWKQWGKSYLSIGGALGNLSFAPTDAPYTPYTLSGTLNLAEVTGIEVEFELWHTPTSGSYSPRFGYRLDEISLSTIPAPPVAPLLALAGLTARGRRRK
jgi:hypothetical protein